MAFGGNLQRNRGLEPPSTLAGMDSVIRAKLDTVVSDLRRIFNTRLEAVVAYGGPLEGWSRTLALVSTLTIDDLSALAAATPSWHARSIATPLVMPRMEFAQSVDAFPVEYGDIIDTHVVLAGVDPFEEVRIAPTDLRRALELAATDAERDFVNDELAALDQ